MPKSIALIGPYPPPYGGVSVHIKRLFHRLKDSGYVPRVYCQPLPPDRIEPGIIPTRGRFTWKWWLLEQSWRPQPAIIHCHDGWHWSFDLWWMVLRGKRVVMTLHDQLTHTKFADTPAISQRAARLLFCSPRVEWIAVSANVHEQLLELGARPEKIQIIPAFILPPQAESNRTTLPDALKHFADQHRPLLVTYGWHLWLDANGQDVYGFDLCIELVRALKLEFSGIGLVILLPQIGDANYFQELQCRVREFNLQTNILFWTEPLDEPHRLWARADVFVRATITDGDALSVREALSLCVPVVASDASPRPDGVVLVPMRNLNALRAAVQNIILNQSNVVRCADQLDNFVSLLAMYER